MNQAYVRVRFELTGDTTTVADLVTPAGDDVADAISAHIAAHRGDTAFTLDLTDHGGWIDAGTCNAGSFIITDEPSPPGTSNDDSRGPADEGAEVIDPWVFPPVGPDERRPREDETGRRRWWP